jgi:hypothetical protein
VATGQRRAVHEKSVVTTVVEARVGATEQGRRLNFTDPQSSNLSRKRGEPLHKSFNHHIAVICGALFKLKMDHNDRRISMIEAWDTGAYRDVREIWEQAEILAGDDKFKGELVRGLHALTGHLEYDIGQIKSVLPALSALSALIEIVERGKRK